MLQAQSAIFIIEGEQGSTTEFEVMGCGQKRRSKGSERDKLLQIKLWVKKQLNVIIKRDTTIIKEAGRKTKYSKHGLQ